ncbi:VOC family protein [Paenisporosarcina indica]|uniref:VOC family protein n=1 Tax=Paenisporosarcina indica TaxID=650093 RepID=UPI00094FA973|nr:VOC family protein [Paenisporosarcina indica]
MNFQLDSQLSLGHLTLQVQSIETQLAFYQQMFGLHILTKTDTHVTLSADRVHPLLILQTGENVIIKPARTTGLYHFALLVPGREDLAYVINHLIQLGIRFDGASDHLFSEAFYLTDPEGNGIEIYRDLPRNEWPRSANGELLAATNPIDFQGIIATLDPTREWNGFPEGTVLGHMHLHVSDLAQADQFYLHTLGFEEITRLQDSALFMSVGGYHHHIATNLWQGKGAPLPPANATGLLEYSLILSSLKEVLALAEHLREQKIEHTVEENSCIVVDSNNVRMVFTSYS